MRPIKIVTDSGADLPPETLHELDIEVVPLVVIAGDQSFHETELSRDEFWRLLNERGTLMTSQPAPGVYMATFERLLQLGFDVLSLSITGRHSSTYSLAASVASQYGGRVYAEDSQGLSLVMGFQVELAARMAKAGAQLNEILDEVRRVRSRTHVTFQLRTLEHLRSSGHATRLMAAADRVARALNLTVLLTLSDGELRVQSVARSYRKGLQRIREDVARLVPIESLAVVHTRVPQVARQLADELAEATGLPRAAVRIAELGAAMSSHGGEGMIGAIAVQRA